MFMLLWSIMHVAGKCSDRQKQQYYPLDMAIHILVDFY